METQIIKVGSIVKTAKHNHLMGVNAIKGGQAECVYQVNGMPYKEMHNLNDLILMKRRQASNQ